MKLIESNLAAAVINVNKGSMEGEEPPEPPKKGGTKKGQNNNISWREQYEDSIYVEGILRGELFDRNVYIQHVLTDL